MSAIVLPNDWDVTEHQQSAWDAMVPEDGVDRACIVWHRRAGKDSWAINLTVCKAHQRVGTYWHLLPTNVQARRTVWDETDRHQRRIIDQAFPPEIRESEREHDMQIRLLNGSLWQLGGSDNYNSLVGSNVVGVVFSEWSLCDPAAWTYIRPILVENNGWAIFIYTPRGRNHGWDLWRTTEKSDRWFREMRSIEDTCREDGSPIMTPEQVQDEIDDGMSEEAAEQEFYCSFAAGVVGAYFARQIEKIRETPGRIGKVPYAPQHAVHLYFDIGIDDHTTCWAGQRVGLQRRWFRYEEWKDTSMQDVADEVAKWPYRIATVNLPHDSRQRDKGTLKSTASYFEDAFDHLPTIVQVHDAAPKKDQIEAGRALVGQSWIDEDACARGLDCLLNYQKQWDDKRKTYLEQPLHNWASHGADAWMLAGMEDVDEPIVEPADLLNHTPVRVVRGMTSGRIRK